MPIIKDTTANNGAALGYHECYKLEADLTANTARVLVRSYASEQAKLDGLPHIWAWNPIAVDPGVVTQPGTILANVEAALTTADGSPFQNGATSEDNSQSLDTLKLRKRAEVTRDRLAADADHFVYTYTVTNPDNTTQSVSKSIRTADKDMTDLLVTASYVSLFGEFDPDWPGGWKAEDDSYVPITTIDAFKDFYRAMYKVGIGNFKHSQDLKSQIDAATTADEVNAIHW